MNVQVCEATPALGQEMVEKWNSSHPPLFRLRPCDITWNFEDQSLMRYQVLRSGDRMALVSAPTLSGAGTGIHSTTLWISLWSGSILDHLNDLAKYARQESKIRIAVGGDEFHFVPGIPAIGAFKGSEPLTQLGFKTSSVSDFIGDLKTPPVLSYIDSAKSICAEHGLRLMPCSAPELLRDLDTFLHLEFPGRWQREFQLWRARDDMGRAFWSLLVQNSEVVGFARMAVRKRVHPLTMGWSPGALRLPLSTSLSRLWYETDSCLGPIGIASKMRGQGAGRALLGLVLESLISNGAERVCIDWTNAINYYSPLAFEQARTYWSAQKEI